ncbi:DJ-1/PfpI family protein [Corynebacterium sp. sy017]|uniref:DJ-1/PfpI family protein n=1 Tax=unclassified Corynebacterium TaxID=2624378 RepID=UPI001186BE1E|nr:MULTISPECIES: DJ-1/PfpI family protein [unclassified Corynebacterium]MBP3089389.1 DJ-1/PfpI family protein [Corynebacterium sp. sy017]TSD90921.1 DJ-1/PfpI family protein [Corynebacterium sp. SY003]
MPPTRISIILFKDFELLDVFGPAEFFSHVENLGVEFLSPDGQPIASSQGVEIIPDGSYSQISGDVLMVPGGLGTRSLATDTHFLQELRKLAHSTTLTLSVCTGSALLAAAGLLDGYRATSNKQAFNWARSHGTTVDWTYKARWVHDRGIWTSSGIAAGMDMAAAFVAHYFGENTADNIAQKMELRISKDPDSDPFAV